VKTKQQSHGQLPILIRYRAQDFQTRYLDDPRIMYIEEFRKLHPDDGFVAMIPSPRVAARQAGRKWPKFCGLAAVFCSLSWTAFVLFMM
jgi:hypothetical protein